MPMAIMTMIAPVQTRPRVTGEGAWSSEGGRATVITGLRVLVLAGRTGVVVIVGVSTSGEENEVLPGCSVVAVESAFRKGGQAVSKVIQ